MNCLPSFSMATSLCRPPERFTDQNLQCSVATQLRCGDIFSHHSITNFLQNVPVKKNWRSINIWQGYGPKFVAYIFGPLVLFGLNINWTVYSFMFMHAVCCCCWCWNKFVCPASLHILSCITSCFTSDHVSAAPSCQLVRSCTHVCSIFIWFKYSLNCR